MEVVSFLSIFLTIFNELLMIKELAPWADGDRQVLRQLHRLKMDFELLYLFSSCLQTWDEQSRNRLRSIITPLRLLWSEKHNGRTNLNLDTTWPVDVQAFRTLAFQLEVKIQQSKLLVQQWCEYFMCSASEQYNSSTYYYMRYPIRMIRSSLDRFSSYIGANVFPYENPIDILNDKLAFLDEFVKNSDSCTDSNKLLLIENFVVAFADKAICLACLYWANEDDEEIEIEMDIVLFDMLQKFIPYAPDITIQMSESLRASSDSIVVSATVASFVDFFFEHLDDDDFLILRDPLIQLFTSLANPPHDYAAAEEEDLLSSQVYALFREHSYLHLYLGEMKEVFSNKKMLLSDFTNQIEIANAKIRQLYYGRFSDCRISLEAEKMDYIYFISVARELYLIEMYVNWADLVRSQLHLYRMELKFMRPFLLCFATWDDADEEVKARLSFMITSLQGIWRKEEADKGLLAVRFRAIRRGDIADWHALAFELERKIQLSKVVMKAWCVNMFRWSFQYKPSANNKVLMHLNSILENLNDLVTYKAGEIVPFKKQIETLQDKSVFLRNFLELTMTSIDKKVFGEFTMFVQVFANEATCLTFLFLEKDDSEKIASEVNPMLSHMLQKINPAMPHVARLYFGILKALYLQQCDSLLFGQTASIFVDFFIENHLATPFEDDFQILHDELIFLLTFLNDPPNRNSEEVICSLIDYLFWEDVYAFLPFDDTEGDFVKKKMILNDFIIKIGTANAKIRLLYSEFQDLSSYNFPKVISPSFLDFIMQKLRNLKERMISDRKFVPFAKYKIIQIGEELVSLRPFFNYAFDLQSELSETWSEVVNLVHLTEYIISSCISSWFVFDHPIWYHMTNLSDIIDRIKVVKTKLEKIKENTLYNARSLPHSASIISKLTEQARPSKINGIFVGFEDEVEKIIRKITSQQKSPFDIVSIVGMGGLGKTTLAKQVYGSSSVKCNFDVFAFCSVSQYHNKRRLLRDILRDIMEDDKKISDMTVDDLAHQLKMCLSRQKYLIVLDDIWDVSAWNEVKSSFPDDSNGSIVMFTTRSREVAENCKIRCSLHQLRFLSEVESWDLLQRKVFRNGLSPPYLDEIGRVIAKNCKGLPLAVVVIAGLLATTEKSPRWWSEVAENVVSYLSEERCMKILELSYKHLPENLKPCLLYLAAFPEGMQIGVKKVILLWIAEGFIQESKTNSLEDVAIEYFHDLVDRSLIIVSARSSNGGIKAFRVHDLIYELCQTKCLEGNISHLDYGIASSSSSDPPSIIEHYRISMRKIKDINNIASGPSQSNARSVFYFQESDGGVGYFTVEKFRLAQVLNLDIELSEYDLKMLGYLVHLRHIDVYLRLESKYIPSLICNLWNIGSLILTSAPGGRIHLPETFWRMKSLRHVKVKNCILKFSDGQEAYLKLDKVVSFSKPILRTGKDVQRLLQRLPAVRKLGFSLESFGNNVETLDFYRGIESLKLHQFYTRRQFMIKNFPSTLKKLTIEHFQLPWTAISAIAELQCLEVLKLIGVSFPEPRLEMENETFQNLKFLKIRDGGLLRWNATTESFPCIEQLVIECRELKQLPSCFGEIPTLKRIAVSRHSSEVVKSSVLRIQEEQMELGIEVEVSILE